MQAPKFREHAGRLFAMMRWEARSWAADGVKTILTQERRFSPDRFGNATKIAALVVAVATLTAMGVRNVSAQVEAAGGKGSPTNAGAAGGTAVTPSVETPPPVGEVTVPEAAATTATSKPEALKPSDGAGVHAGSAESNSQPESPFSAFENPNRGPINIQSDSLTLDNKNNTTIFSGHVHATQADGQLTCNTLDVQHGKDFHEVQQMVANGDVRISQGVSWCTGDHAVMNQGTHTVVLTGSPVCHNANDEVTGTKITVYLQTGQSVVERAKAIIFPRHSKSGDNGAAADHAGQPGQ